MPATFPSLQPFFAFLLPPLCLTCRATVAVAEVPLCERCDCALDALRPVRPLPPPGVSEAWAAAPHEGVARDLVAALKFRRLLPAAVMAAELIAERAPPKLLSGS